MSSTDRIPNPASIARDSQQEKNPVDSTWSEGFTLFGVTNDVEPELTKLRSIFTRLVSGSSVEQVSSTVSILNDLIPGIEGCLILLYNPSTHQLRPSVALNLSQEFITALERNEQRTQVIAIATRQTKPTTLLYIPGNKQFRFLWSSAEREGIRTLWLVPWQDRDGSLLGIFLFTSGQHFSPTRQAITSVMLLIDWLSMALHETRATESAEQHDNQPHASSAIEANSLTPSVNTDTPGGSTTVRSLSPELIRYTKPDAVTVLSHELLSPLTLIKGYAATMLQLSEVITGEQRKHYCQGIESATNRVIKLLESLRDISQFEEGKPRLLIEQTYLSDLLREAAKEIQNQTSKHVIKLHVPRSLPSLNIDRQKILQVMINLLGNAVKYSSQGGDIEITARQVQSEEKLREVFKEVPPLKTPCVIVSVSDHGVGIPEDDLVRIFDKFYRVDNRLIRTTPGAGLGLYICRMIVAAHDGHIWAKSTPGIGSTFFFSLPL
jgi:signal transduction histidine kinase